MKARNSFITKKALKNDEEYKAAGPVVQRAGGAASTSSTDVVPSTAGMQIVASIKRKTSSVNLELDSGHDPKKASRATLQSIFRGNAGTS